MAKGTCSIEGCESPASGRGWCSMHYTRWRRHGDPNINQLRKHFVCTVEGCERPHKCHGYCALHWDRVRTKGEPGPAELLYAERGSGHVTNDGYRIRFAPDHPLASASKQVMEHRLVLFDRIGPGEHLCHWCSSEITWDASWPRDGARALVADHLDYDRLNNAPENLVPSCHPCNAGRWDLATWRKGRGLP